MRKNLFVLTTALLSFAATAMAGGLMTNTNYHIAFDRMMARGATFDVDAAYSNPAGTVFGHEGWQLSLNFQKPWQNRDIEADVPNFLANPSTGSAGMHFNKKYEGKASAPIVPALFATYKKDNWAVSSMIGIVGSGGFVKYDDGIPMLSVPLMALLAQKGVAPTAYDLDSKMEGKQYIYGAQVNFAYRFTDFLSAAVGIRANYYDGFNRGHLIAKGGAALGGAELVNLQLDCLQKGWGFAPIVSVDFNQGPLTIAARYEFRTKINTENDTQELSAKIKNTDPTTAAAVPYIEGATALAQFGDKVAPYQDGAKTRYDMPALLSVAVGYEFTDKLRATVKSGP